MHLRGWLRTALNGNSRVAVGLVLLGLMPQGLSAQGFDVVLHYVAFNHIDASSCTNEVAPRVYYRFAVNGQSASHRRRSDAIAVSNGHSQPLNVTISTDWEFVFIRAEVWDADLGGIDRISWDRPGPSPRRESELLNGDSEVEQTAPRELLPNWARWLGALPGPMADDPLAIAAWRLDERDIDPLPHTVVSGARHRELGITRRECSISLLYSVTPRRTGIRR